MDDGRSQRDTMDDAERLARWERITRRMARAGNWELSGHGEPLTLELTQALLIAHDLYMLGEIDEEPSLRWTSEDAETSLSPWSVRVVPDGALTWNRQPDL